MPQFTVDEDLAAIVERLAKPKPFENLSFNAALRRVLQSLGADSAIASKGNELDQLLAESSALTSVLPKKAPSPSPIEWAANVPELKSKKGLNTWKAICDVLSIETAGDSARRKLQNWVRANRSKWPPVPDVDVEANARPTSGKELFAFTDKWLTDAGLFDGDSIEKREAIRIAGQTAVAYHLREQNFTEWAGEISLTPKGKAHFLCRRDRQP